MRISVYVDDEFGAKIESAAEKLDIKKSEWVRIACTEYLSASDSVKSAEETGPDSFDNENNEIIEAQNKEILQLKREVEAQNGIQDAYSKLISEKDQRIDDMKESISRIEAMSITTTDQIASSKDDRINDLSQMIEHLQAQAAAHSRVLQSSLKPALESENGKESTPDGDDDNVDMVQKPRWMFWK
ncbi:hypothetical protein [Methanogenium sp. MK-MG]|uniref:hypothetical protein n=1 Tax=Methanogenium sp. MK-MG TaxID=2599926 RepID=UPI0013ECF5C4|nr:hypothetical protein [Methanogenium sp. MK-MG]KAF1076878.1 hypothetical protein MKMG_01416 [Methanogenium sp. MK-MG]